MHSVKRAAAAAAAAAVMLLAAAACGQAEPAEESKDISSALVYESSLELEYAEQFSADFYEGGYALLSVADGSRYLLVPEDLQAPDDLDEDIIVLQRPLQNIYLVSSGAMSSFVDIGALDMIRFSGTQQSDWYIEEAAAAMADGSILYAGKYSEPDYEKILAENCGLAIENTMILHTPEVKENLEKFGIPVMIERSSYETHPLGRCEWVKFFGVLTDKQEEAMNVFNEQKEYTENVISRVAEKDSNAEKPTVAYFYISSNGSAVVRKGGDYISKMIEMAGGEYVFSDLGTDDGKATSNISIQMETFYEGACDADYIIYNGTMDNMVNSVDEMLAKAPVLADFKAVKEGHVYGTGRNFYQEINICGMMVNDLYNMFNGDQDMTFLKKLS